MGEAKPEVSVSSCCRLNNSRTSFGTAYYLFMKMVWVILTLQKIKKGAGAPRLLITK